MSVASRSTWLFLLAVSATSVVVAHDGALNESHARYEDDLFRWSSEPSPFCSIYPKDAALALSGLREIEKRIGGKPYRVAVITSEQCSGETTIGIAFKRSASSKVQYWLFVFGGNGSLVREIGTE